MINIIQSNFNVSMRLYDSGGRLNRDNVKEDCVIWVREWVEGWETTELLQTVPATPNQFGA